MCRLRLAIAVDQLGGIVAGEAMISVLRLAVIAAFGLAQGAVEAVERQEGEGVDAEIVAHLLDIHFGGEQLFLGWHVDAVKVREADRRAADAEMDLLGARGADHLHYPARGVAADDGVVDQHDAFARKRGIVGGVFEGD